MTTHTDAMALSRGVDAPPPSNIEATVGLLYDWSTKFKPATLEILSGSYQS